MSKTAKPAATKPAEVAAAPAPSGNKKMMIIIAVVVAALAGGGGWFFARSKHDNAPHAEEVKVEAPKKALFLPLEAFTVNLQKETSEQYLQVGMTLKFFDPALEEKLKSNLPEIRSRILLLLATKKASELGMPEGKIKLIDEVRSLSNKIIGIATKPAAASVAAAAEGHAPATEHAPAAAEHAPAPAPAAEPDKGVVDVLFTAFIIQ